MGRKALLVLLGVLAAVAFLERRRRGRAGSAATPDTNGSPADSRASLRRFVEAGERLRGGEQASTER